MFTTAGLKPAIDAYRVCIGKEQQPGQTLDAMTEVRLEGGGVFTS